jgi:hypothetical protein
VERKGRLLLATIALAATYGAHVMGLPEGAVVFLGMVAVGLCLRALSGAGWPGPTLCAGGCGRHIQVLAYGRTGAVMISKEEMTSDVGAAEQRNAANAGASSAISVTRSGRGTLVPVASGETRCITNGVPCSTVRCIS